jgi:hypothetical protein
MKNYVPLLPPLLLIMAGCTSTNYTASMTGVSDYATIVVKDFTSLGIITVNATETHHSGPLGFVKSIEGGKVTYADLMKEAAKLEADDIINVRIDINSNYTKSAFDWLTGWNRTYSYTGTALAIKYLDKGDASLFQSQPQLGGLPKAPQRTPAVRRGTNGAVMLK